MKGRQATSTHVPKCFEEFTNMMKNNQFGNVNIMDYRSAGIIPLAMKDGQYHVLIGSEKRKSSKFTWSEFGGKRKKNDKDFYETAAREFCEETMYSFYDDNECTQKTNVHNANVQKMDLHTGHTSLGSNSLEQQKDPSQSSSSTALDDNSDLNTWKQMKKKSFDYILNLLKNETKVRMNYVKQGGYVVFICPIQYISCEKLQSNITNFSKYSTESHKTDFKWIELKSLLDFMKYQKTPAAKKCNEIEFHRFFKMLFRTCYFQLQETALELEFLKI